MNPHENTGPDGLCIVPCGQCDTSGMCRAKRTAVSGRKVTHTTEPDVNGFYQTFDEAGCHRLHKGEKATRWAGYRSWTYLEGMVGFTAYYIGDGGILAADEFAKSLAVRS